MTDEERQKLLGETAKPEPTISRSAKDRLGVVAGEYLRTKGNFITIALLALVQLCSGVFRIDTQNGQVVLPHYDSWYGWMIYILTVLFPVAIGFTISLSFRKQGFFWGLNMPDMKELKAKYDSLIRIDHIEKKPRSLDEYKKITRTKSAVIKLTLGFLSSFMLTGLTTGVTFNGVLSIVLVLVLWGGFGMIDMYNSQDYILTEYRQWLLLQIKELEGGK